MKKLALLPLVALAVLSGCQSEEKKEKSDNGLYETLVVGPSQETLQVRFSATVRGQQYVEIRPQVSGTITKILVKEGAHVRKGQTLFIIDQVPYRAAVNTATAAVQSAEAKVENAKMVLESKKELLDENIISNYDYEAARHALAEARANLASAQAQLVNARNNLSYTEIKSPVEGVASMIPYRVGALVSSNISEPLTTVSDDSRVHTYFSMTENQMLSLVSVHGSIERAIENLPEIELLLSNGKPYGEKGKIDAISGTVNTKTGSISIRATFPNPGHLLRDGSTATVVIPEYHDSVIVIPQAATFEIQNKVFCYRVQADTCASTPIEVLPFNNGKSYIVASGLNVGDEIIAAGAGLVKEGAVVARDKGKGKKEKKKRNHKK